MHPKAPAISY